MAKLKLTNTEFRVLVENTIKKVLKEDWHNEDYTDRGADEPSNYNQSKYNQSENDYENDYENVMNIPNGSELDDALYSYIESLIWSSGEDLDAYLNKFQDGDYSVIDTQSVNKCIEDISEFITLIKNTPGAIEEMDTCDEESFGHNFALSRNGRGSGFFDDNNDILQDIARNFGKANIYVGDDGKLHIQSSTIHENISKIKLTKNELSEIVKRSVIKVLKEEHWDGGQSEDYENSQESFDGSDPNLEEKQISPEELMSLADLAAELNEDAAWDIADLIHKYGDRIPLSEVETELMAYGITLDDLENVVITKEQGDYSDTIHEAKKPRTVKLKINELKEIIKQIIKENN